MIISVLNFSKIPDAKLLEVIRAINRQITEDFKPYWSFGATLRLEGRSTDRPDKSVMTDMRGDAIIYLRDEADVVGALGYHEQNAAGIPFGFVFTQLSEQLGESWTVTLSHEALELVADPLVNLLVAGPHPQEDRTVFHWFEMSDAVQGQTYKCDGVEVSNFVLPLYFTPTAEKGSRNDFLGEAIDGKTLTSFGINKKGYIGFFDPELSQHVTFANAGDDDAVARLAAKGAQHAGRRAYRIHTWSEHNPPPGGVTPTVAAAAISTASKSGKEYTRIDDDVKPALAAAAPPPSAIRLVSLRTPRMSSHGVLASPGTNRSVRRANGPTSS